MKSNSKKKILFLSGKRGGFDAMLPLSNLFINSKKFSYKIILTDQHMNRKFGSTHIFYSKKLKKKNIIKINSKQKNDTSIERIKSFSRLISQISTLFLHEKPDLIILYGDRCESLVTGIVSLNLNIPICHFQGGDRSGNLDEKIRHSITKISDIHFVSNKSSKKRLIQLGENPKKVFLVGDSHIDSLKKVIINKNIIFNHFNINKKDNYCVLLFHPDGTSKQKNKSYIKNILKALEKTNLKVFCIYPCTDIGYQPIIEGLEKIKKKNKNFKVFKNIKYDYFINLIKFSKFFIGNSSSGIIESTYLKLAALNLGNRQNNRLKGSNIINCRINFREITKKIKYVMSKKFKKNIKEAKLLYGDGKSFIRAFKIINREINNIDLNKKFYDKR